MSDTNDEILHIIGRGVASLRADLASAQESAEMFERGTDENYARAKLAEKRLAEAEEKVTAEFRRRIAAEDDAARTTQRLKARITDYDRITLDLYHFIVELSGHRDTAKTKAERVALGHVVERLKEIRGIDDYDRPGLEETA